MSRYLASISSLAVRYPRQTVASGLIMLAAVVAVPAVSYGLVAAFWVFMITMFSVHSNIRMSSSFDQSQVSSRRESTNGHKRVLIVGAGEIGVRLARELMEQDGDRCQIIGFVDDDPNARTLPEIAVIGSRCDIMSLVEHHQIDEVIISHSPGWQQELAEELIRNGKRNLQIKLVPGLYETMIAKPKFKRINDIPLMQLPGIDSRKGYDRTKRLLDIIFSVFALIAASPCLLLSALLIKLTSPGPVIYRQERVGKDGCVFTIFKLRTMRRDAEEKTGPRLSDAGDDRTTSVGRFLRTTKLDEIPQFYNVLRGDMSVVGPRPERPYFVNIYKERIPSYSERLRVLPGITGLAQVHGYYLTDADTKLKYDLMYIYNRSVLLDVKLVGATVFTLITRLRRES